MQNLIQKAMRHLGGLTVSLQKKMERQLKKYGRLVACILQL